MQHMRLLLTNSLVIALQASEAGEGSSAAPAEGEVAEGDKKVPL